MYFLYVTPAELEQLPHHLLDKLIETAATTMFDAKEAFDADPSNKEQGAKYLRAREWLIACQDARRKPRPAILRIKIDRVFDTNFHERT